MKIFIFFIIGITANAQTLIQGTVRDESGHPLYLSEVLIPELKMRTSTDEEGHFSLTVPPGAMMKILKVGYYREDVRLKPGQSRYEVVLKEVPVAIEEVEIRRKMSQDLTQDLIALQGSAKTRLMQEEVRQYLRRPSAENVLKPKPGEFVQPVGPGASVTLWIDNKWTLVNYLEYLETYFGKAFFEQELGLLTTEIQPFVYFILAKVDHKDILKYGRALPEDLARFEKVAWQNILYFKNVRRHPARN